MNTQKRRFKMAVLIILCMCAAVLSIPAAALGITLSWERPDAQDITGYHIYYGQAGTNYRSMPRVIIDSPDQTQCQITDLEPGITYEFSATSVDTINNRESDFSPIISYTAPESCSISAGAEGGGAVMIDSNVGIHENVIYSYGETVEMTAVPDKGYSFIYWKVNGEVVSRQKQYTFTAESNRTLTATFRKVDLTAVMMLLLD